MGDPRYSWSTPALKGQHTYSTYATYMKPRYSWSTPALKGQNTYSTYATYMKPTVHRTRLKKKLSVPHHPIYLLFSYASSKGENKKY